MKAVGWSEHEGHIWICSSCGKKKFEFHPNKIIYSDTSAPRGRKKRAKKEAM
jgi:predicted  nucleic acid-binding Zn-ribbon protein